MLKDESKRSDCSSCNGLNTSCPDGCGRDPITGELDGSRLSPPAQAEASTLPGEVAVSRTRAALIEACAKIAETLPIGGGTLSSWINTNESPMGATRRHIATAIRAHAAPPTTPAVESGEAGVERMALAFAKEFYGPGFDPFHNPEAFDLAQRATVAALAAIDGETT